MTNIDIDLMTTALADIKDALCRDMDANLDWTPTRAQITARVRKYCDNPSMPEVHKEMIDAILFDKLSI